MTMKPEILIRVVSDEGGAFEIGAVYPARDEGHGFYRVQSDEYGALLMRAAEVEIVSPRPAERPHV